MKMLNIIKQLLKKENKNKSVFTNRYILNSSNIKIGDFTYGIPKIYSWDKKTNLEIGKFCSIADNVKILMGGNHRTDWISTYPFSELNKDFQSGKYVTGHPASKGNIVIGNDVWIGNDVIILSGVTIGDGAVIGAGSVVTKSIEPYNIVAGNPAIVLKKRFSNEIIEDLLKIKWWNWPIQKINENIQLICSNNIEDFIDRHKHHI